MKKILVIIGTRPEAIKLFPVVHALRDDPQFDCIVCTTGQHREMVDDVLDFAGVVPDYRLDAMRAGQSLDELTARLMMQIGPVIDKVQPDWVVVQGDTTSAFCGALAAYYRRIRVCHVEAGLRTGDIHQPWPEEANRKMIATFATLHCAPTEGAAENLRREGVAQEAIHVTGNTVVDALMWTQERLEERPELAGRMVEIERRFADRMIVAVTCHRRENAGRGFAEVLKAVAGLSSQRCLGLVFPVHPAFSRDVEMSGLAGSANAALPGPLPYPDFIRLLAISSVVITDSGGIQEEAPVLGVPVLVTREITERPEGVAAGATRIVECSSSAIEREVHRIIYETTRSPSTVDAFLEYGQGASAQLIVGFMA